MDSKKILLADDSSDVCALTRLKLEKVGYKVFLASDGEQALDMIRRIFSNHVFNLIILDYLMPKLSGLEVLKKIRGSKEYGSLPVIFFTAVDDTGEKEQVLLLGVEDYILKSEGIDRLVKRAQGFFGN